MIGNQLSKNHDLALLFLRLGVALVFIVAGWGKLTGIEGVQGFFGGIGIPLPGIMAWVVGIIEFFGGLMVLAGFRIRIPSLLLACVMVVALLTTKLGGDFGPARVDILLLMMTLSLALMGPGNYSVDAKVGNPGKV